MILKYMIGEKVKVVTTGNNTGEILQIEDRTLHIVNPETKQQEALHTIRYLVKARNANGYMSQQWVDESLLENSFELIDRDRVHKVLIDVALMTGNYEMIKEMNEGR